MRWSESIKNIAPALAKVTGEVKDAIKDKEGYGYSYAPLDQVLKIVRPILSKNDISLLQSEKFDDEKSIVTIETMLLHKSGEWIISEVSAPFEKLKNMNIYQIAGSAITYLRRYGLATALGIAADEDTDAAGESEEPQVINDEQAKEIEALIAQTGTDRAKFLKFFQVNDLKELPIEKFEKAKALLTKKLKKESKDENTQS